MPVYSVGVSLVPAGGVLEAEMRLVWSLVAARSPSGGGALRSFFVARPSSSSSEVCRSTEFLFPRSDRRRPIWFQMFLKEKMAWSLAMKTTASDVGPQGPLTGDFPAAWGLLPIQGVRGAAAVPARHRLVLVGVDIGVWRDLCVIFALFCPSL